MAGGSGADGAKIVQQTGAATWTLSTTSDGSYTLRSTATGKLLDVNGFDPTVGLQLQLWSANSGTNQLWCVRPTADGSAYTIASHDSGPVADVYGAATGDGARVVQWTANGGANQQWQLVPS